MWSRKSCNVMMMWTSRSVDVDHNLIFELIRRMRGSLSDGLAIFCVGKKLLAGRKFIIIENKKFI